MTLVPLPDDAPARTIVQLVLRAGGHGARPVLTATSAGGMEHTVQSRDLPELVARAAGFLAARGIEQRDHVGIHLDNRAGLEALAMHLAAQWLGAVAVPVGTRLSAREARGILTHAGVSLLVTAGEHRQVARDAAAEITTLADCSEGLMALTADAPAHDAAPLAEADLADILYTSGTTGRPKGAEFTHGNCVACGMELAHAVGLSADDVYQTAIPYFTSTGAHTNPLMALVAGAHLVLEPAFDQHATMRRLALHGTTAYFGVPSMLALLMRDVDVAAVIPPTLRTIVFGGSTTTAAAISALAEAFPGRGLVNLYGQTEAGPGGTVLGPADILDKPGSVGCRGNGPRTEFRVVRDDGSDVAIGETGEILLRSPAVMRGYHRDPEGTATALRGGWLHTTDLGRIDSDGYLWFVDRRRDLVIRGGFNVSTSEVEAVLQSHPAVQDAAVIGVPHDVLGEDVYAFVVTGGSAEQSDIVAFARERLADYKVPRRIEFISELPRGPMGKVLKRELRPTG